MDPTQNPQDPNAGVPPAPSQDDGLGGDTNAGAQPPVGGVTPPATPVEEDPTAPVGENQGLGATPSGDEGTTPPAPAEPPDGGTPGEDQEEQQPPAVPSV